MPEPKSTPSDMDICPSTIGGIKRYAKQIKRTTGVKYHEALDIAANKASFKNYAHALKELNSEGM